MSNKKLDQQKVNFPAIANNQSWNIIGYLCGKSTRKCPHKFKDFHSLQYIGKSGDYFHVLGNGNLVLVCSITIN